MGGATDAGAGPAAAMSEHDKAKQMDGPGVAREPGFDLNRGGRECANETCVQREAAGAGTFRRCSRCRQLYYCSTFCQRVHWKRGHSRVCKPAAAAPAAAVDASAARPAEPDTREPAPPAPPAPAPAGEGREGEEDEEADRRDRGGGSGDADAEGAAAAGGDGDRTDPRPSVQFELAGKEITSSSASSRTLQVVLSVPSLASAAGVRACVDEDRLLVFLPPEPGSAPGDPSSSSPDIDIALAPELRAGAECVDACAISFRKKTRRLVARLELVPL